METSTIESPCKSEPDSNKSYPSGDESELSHSEDDSEEEEVGIAIDLPHRKTRANRYTTVINNDEDEFWQHETWNEEKNDEEYVCSEGEAIYKDIVSSDFDKDESSEEDQYESGTIEIEKPQRKKNVYQDPTMLAKKLAKTRATLILKKKPKKPIDEAKIEKQTQNNETPRSPNDKIETRITTQKKSKEVALMQIELERNKLERSRIHEKFKSYPQPIQYEPTQEEHLNEAKRVEEFNKQSLIALQEWEEEKKRYVEYKKQSYQGHYSVWISWASDRLIMSDETAKRAEIDEGFDIYDLKNNPPAKYYKCDESKDSPELLIFTDGKVPKDYQNDAPLYEVKSSPKCIVTGNDAKYLDPLTNCFYENASSFKKIRQWYYDAQDKQVIDKLHEIEVLLKDKVNEIDNII